MGLLLIGPLQLDNRRDDPDRGHALIKAGEALTDSATSASRVLTSDVREVMVASSSETLVLTAVLEGEAVDAIDPIVTATWVDGVPMIVPLLFTAATT
jgi:hypothetical protein